MVLLRGVFWLSLVAMLVPYSKFDSSVASFVIDHEALMRRAAALPHLCHDNPRLCDRTRALAGAIGDESLVLAEAVAAGIRSAQQKLAH